MMFKHCLLSILGLAFALGAPPGASEASAPAELDTPLRAEVFEGTMHYLFEMEAGDLFGEKPVRFYFRVENRGPHQVVIPNPGRIGPMFGIEVFRDGCSWYSMERECGIVFNYPRSVFFGGLPWKAQPGEVREIHVEWSEPVYNRIPGPGSYTATAGFRGGGFHSPRGGLQIEFSVLNSAVSTGLVTWGRIKSLYSLDSN